MNLEVQVDLRLPLEKQARDLAEQFRPALAKPIEERHIQGLVAMAAGLFAEALPVRLKDLGLTKADYGSPAWWKVRDETLMLTWTLIFSDLFQVKVKAKENDQP